MNLIRITDCGHLYIWSVHFWIVNGWNLICWWLYLLNWLIVGCAQNVLLEAKVFLDIHDLTAMALSFFHLMRLI